MFLQVPAISSPEYFRKFLQVVYCCNLNTRSDAMQETQLAVYPPGEKNHVLVPEQYFLFNICFLVIKFVITVILFIYPGGRFQKIDEFNIGHGRYNYSALFKILQVSRNS